MMFFSKNTLSMNDRASLLLSLISADLSAFTSDHPIPGRRQRSRMISQWLNEHGHKAGARFKAGMSVASEMLSKHYIAMLGRDQLEETAILSAAYLNNRPLVPEEQEFVQGLLELCKKAMVAAGLDS